MIAPYSATSKEQLSLQKGQMILVRKKTETGWWQGEIQASGTVSFILKLKWLNFRIHYQNFYFGTIILKHSGIIKIANEKKLPLK